MFYGKSSDFDNEAGVGYFRNEVGAAAITNLEVGFKATDSVSLSVGATNVFDEMPDKRNSEHRAIQFGNNDNSAVAQYPVVLAVRHQRCLLLRKGELQVLKQVAGMDLRVGGESRSPSSGNNGFRQGR